ncbi:hypothetical protein NLG97_g5859 [Lecanicillium saksenae]|uniref:Uncharacterized protein n=1 Tax=Lecanicillium saksenae TaxID=468837 RepID=A0ACC1QV39_9HYPO|nr:hypothetical protein NLG97_g5859 [Lecanicillium saksenae]
MSVWEIASNEAHVTEQSSELLARLRVASIKDASSPRVHAVANTVLQSSINQPETKPDSPSNMVRLHTLITLLLAFIGVTTLASGPTPTPIYIDKVAGYKSLPACAEVPLSIIIRDMVKGCGDGAVLTSFSCFCTDSSTRFAFDISTAVASKCGPTAEAQVTSALDVFDRYCADGPAQLAISKQRVRSAVRFCCVVFAFLCFRSCCSVHGANHTGTAPGEPTAASTATAPKSTSSRSNGNGKHDMMLASLAVCVVALLGSV